MYVIATTALSCRMQNHTYEAGVTYSLSYDWEIGDFDVKDKARNALIYPDLVPGFLPACAGFALRWGWDLSRMTPQKYKILFNLQLFGEKFHALMHGIRFINDFYRTH